MSAQGEPRQALTRPVSPSFSWTPGTPCAMVAAYQTRACKWLERAMDAPRHDDENLATHRCGVISIDLPADRALVEHHERTVPLLNIPDATVRTDTIASALTTWAVVPSRMAMKGGAELRKS